VRASRLVLAVLVCAFAALQLASACNMYCYPPDALGCVSCYYEYPCSGGFRCCPNALGGMDCHDF